MAVTGHSPRFMVRPVHALFYGMINATIQNKWASFKNPLLDQNHYFFFKSQASDFLLITSLYKYIRDDIYILIYIFIII